MVVIILLTTTITLIIVAPVAAIAICKTAKELRKEEEQK